MQEILGLNPGRCKISYQLIIFSGIVPKYQKCLQLMPLSVLKNAKIVLN